jgi:hypothetical protein
MAGGYNHVVTDSGNLGSNQFVVDMLETGGDVFETIEAMYGMIWFLAGEMIHLTHREASPTRSPEAVKTLVEEARKNYKRGLTISQEVHEISPDRRED